MRSRLFAWLVVCLVAIGAAVVSLDFPFAGFAGETFVDIPKGIGTARVARLLAGAGVIRYRWQFVLARLLKPKRKLQAGEYRFIKAASVWEVFDRMARGDVFYYTFTVPEGQTVFDIAASLDKLGVISGDAFLHTALDPSLIRDLAPEAPTLEGYLYPDTYWITRRTTPEELCRQMTEQFRKNWKQIGDSAPVHATVTLASLIEKETALSEERPIVSSVFHNRLRIGMPLECDPTAIYAAILENRYRGTLTHLDLASKNPYNTYQHAGLPPGPIANPGMDSLRAALNPAKTNYLYFVAKPDGSGAHQFSTKLEKHRDAVFRYRRANHKTNQAGGTARLSRHSPPSTNH